MKHIHLLPLSLLAALLLSCGGTLTDEQRKKFREEMDKNTIKHVTEAQLMEAAYTKGREIAGQVQHVPLTNRKKFDSVQRVNKVKLFALEPGDKLLLAIEQQIVDAYTAGPDSLVLNDNVQLLGDSILYTTPIMKQNPDGSTQFSYALGIRLSRKEIVLSIKE